MLIHRLDLVDFRNYASLALELPAGATVLTGPNGSGKTNIIEAIHLVLTGFSHRAGRDGEMVRHGEDAFSVRALVERDTLPGDRIEYQVLYQGRRKTVRRGRQVLTGRARTAAMGSAVAFAPDDLSIVKGGPAARRGFLDAVAGKAAPAYRTAMRRYETALAHRNRLLANDKAAAIDAGQLAVWTQQLVTCGGVVLAWRLRCLSKLYPLINRYYGELASDGEEMQIEYNQAHGHDFAVGCGDKAYSLEPDGTLDATIEAALAATTALERLRGTTLAGPHRDDLRLGVGGQDSRIYASQGQQRSIALALRLAENAFLRGVTGERPVLLLDDVFSELDERRRDALLVLLGLDSQGQQTFLTATDLSGIPARGLGEVTCFAVADGGVRQYA